MCPPKAPLGLHRRKKSKSPSCLLMKYSWNNKKTKIEPHYIEMGNLKGKRKRKRNRSPAQLPRRATSIPPVDRPQHRRGLTLPKCMSTNTSTTCRENSPSTPASQGDSRWQTTSHSTKSRTQCPIRTPWTRPPRAVAAHICDPSSLKKTPRHSGCRR